MIDKLRKINVSDELYKPIKNPEKCIMPYIISESQKIRKQEIWKNIEKWNLKNMFIEIELKTYHVSARYF